MNTKYLFGLIILFACSQESRYAEQYSNGKVKIEGQTLNDRRIGEWFQYDSTGTLTKKYQYENGAIRKSWTYLDSILYAIQEFNENEVKEGLTTTFYSDGKIQSKTKWQNGKQVGEQIFYFQNGNLERSFSSISDKIIDFEQYYENGNLMAKAEVFGDGLAHFFDSLGSETVIIKMENGRNVDTVKVFP